MNLYQGVNDGQKEREGMGKGLFPCPLPPASCPLLPITHSNSKSNMAGQINNYELVMW